MRNILLIAALSISTFAVGQAASQNSNDMDQQRGGDWYNRHLGQATTQFQAQKDAIAANNQADNQFASVGEGQPGAMASNAGGDFYNQMIQTQFNANRSGEADLRSQGLQQQEQE